MDQTFESCCVANPWTKLSRVAVWVQGMILGRKIKSNPWGEGGNLCAGDILCRGGKGGNFQ